jgi:hypothetical protein
VLRRLAAEEAEAILRKVEVSAAGDS